jgi:putative transposase
MRAAVTVWNLALEQRQMTRQAPWRIYWRGRVPKHSRNPRAQWTEVQELCQAYPWIAQAPRSCLYYVIDELDRAIANARAKHTRWPSWRSSRRYRCLTFGTYGQTHRLEDGHIWLQKLGRVKLRMHRPIPEGARLGEAKVTQAPSGRWYASITVKTPDIPANGRDEISVGINRGLAVYVATSDGLLIPRPDYWHLYAEEIVRLQQIVSRRERGSSRRDKARRDLARTWEAVSARRRQYAYELAGMLLDRYDGVIALEDYDIRGMLVEERPEEPKERERNLHRRIADAAWGAFAGALRHKAEERGRTVVTVPAPGITTTCSRCQGDVSEQAEAAVRWHREILCPGCNLRIHVDVNAARNVLVRAKEGMNGQERMPVAV